MPKLSPIPADSLAGPAFYALVPCAGSGSRAGTDIPKQYVPLAGQPMVAHTLRALAAVPALTATLVVLAPGDTAFTALLPHFAGPRGWLADVGGETRATTVQAGLRVLRERGAGADDWVLVHDAARCLLQPQAVQALIDACGRDSVGGLLALPVADTLKQSLPHRPDAPARVAATVDRSGKWAAQTPQMFRIGLLQQALAQAGAAVTDEASAIEALGHAPVLVPGSPENFKLTFPADFDLAERLLRTRPQESS